MARTPPNGRFTSLHVENWRNFTAIETDLADRAFLVGPNAAGKSNFLDIFRFLRDIAAVGGGFQAAVDRRGGVRRVRALAARQQSDVLIEVGLVLDGVHWTYSLRFNQDRELGPVVKREYVHREAEQLLARDASRESDPVQSTQTLLEQIIGNQKFRPIGDFFASLRYLHLVPQLIREPDRSVGKKDDPYGGDFLEQVATTPKRTRETRLRKISQALRVAVPQLESLELEPDAKGTPHLRGKYKSWRARGAWQEETEFSDGTLRLMGLLWALQDGGGPVLLEEPELSLHPEVVRYIPQMLHSVSRRRGRQILLSTHSPELLQDSGIGLDEVLLLVPGTEGTTVKRADRIDEVVDLLHGGATLTEAVIPLTRPERANQLALFDW